jgi:hypothetical protein
MNMRVHFRVKDQLRYPLGEDQNNTLRSALDNRKQHAIDSRKPQSREIYRT